ncbi:serine/arginine-rich splicing factor 3-like [Oscarella lobularis]|uniref:serine/arginine-rich splicing factor 3-like n=1 Tax=Oscarella lobularis TaxID=121494 RepID=UPI0033134542
MSTFTVFVGRLSRSTRSRDLEDAFRRYGPMRRCELKTVGRGMAYGFIDYEDRRDAEDAIRHEHGRELLGCNIVVEWAKGEDYRRRGDYSRRSPR